MSTDCGCGGATCGCGCGCGCGGAAETALAARANRPGLARVDTRLGGHGTFLAAAMRALSSAEMPALRALGTRAVDDPIIANLDAWAMIADILTFYRDRFANEAYLRTAREERSLRELAAQVGYRPRPGVSASVALAYLLDPTAKPVTIPPGARVQSIPKPGEQMQTFETGQPLDARAEWSRMPPRRSWIPPLDRIDALLRSEFRLKGAQLAVRPGERMLFIFGKESGWQVAREVAAARIDIAEDCVVVALKPRPGLTAALAEKLLVLADEAADAADDDDYDASTAMRGIASYLLGASPRDARQTISESQKEVHRTLEDIELAPVEGKEPTSGAGIDAILSGASTLAGRVSAGGPRKVFDALSAAGGTRTALIAGGAPGVREALYAAWANLPANAANTRRSPELHLLRLVAGAFGSNAPMLLPDEVLTDGTQVSDLDEEFVFLDSLADGVASGGFALVDAPFIIDPSADIQSSARLIRIGRVREVQATARSDYGLTARVTRLDVVDLQDDEPLGLPASTSGEKNLVRLLRQILYFAQSEPVRLAPEPIEEDIAGDTIMLDGLYPDITPGRSVLIAGERRDILVGGAAIPGVSGGEPAMVAAVTQAPIPGSPGDTPHTVLSLTAPLTFRYRRASATVYGNVVEATHGETVSETLGAGDASQAFQRFQLRRAPLTFVPAPTTSGVADALRVDVNGIALSEVDSLIDAGPDDRVFQLTLGDKGAGSIEGGDGKTGARLPTGVENLRATYRTGLGAAGNVDAGQISLVTTRPLGVTGVINPLRASGGADRDGIAAIRRNTPIPALALSPLSRLVSIEDYEHFARGFAGIGDVCAAMLTDGRHRLVHVTIAGIDDAPIAPGDMTVAALVDAYGRFGDPALPVAVAVRERVTLLLQAGVALIPDADRIRAEALIRARLADAFSFARQGLARPAYRSALISVLQTTPGVDHVDVDVFGGISDTTLGNAALLAKAVQALRDQARRGRPLAYVAALPARLASPQDIAGGERLLPAQVVYARADVPDTLILNWL